MRLDAHQHFWQYDRLEHGWMTEAMSAIKRDYLPADLWPVLDQAGIDGTIAVQVRQSLWETEWLLELSDRHDFIRGVVGWVDMRSPRVKEQLQRFSRHPKFVGVRHIVQDEVDDRFMLAGDFLRGLGTLAELGLTYDLLLFPKHLPIAVQVVQQFPDQRFVLDHIAKPSIAAGTLTPWANDVRALSRFENVYCKVSGLVTEAAWGQWKAEDFKPYLDVVFEVFGTGRLMFGSDWPVCKLSADYATVVGLVRDYTARLSDSDQNMLFGLNAAQFYGLPHATADHQS